MEERNGCFSRRKNKFHEERSHFLVPGIGWLPSMHEIRRCCLETQPLCCQSLADTVIHGGKIPSLPPFQASFSSPANHNPYPRRTLPAHVPSSEPYIYLGLPLQPHMCYPSFRHSLLTRKALSCISIHSFELTIAALIHLVLTVVNVCS